MPFRYLLLCIISVGALIGAIAAFMMATPLAWIPLALLAGILAVLLVAQTMMASRIEPAVYELLQRQGTSYSSVWQIRARLSDMRIYASRFSISLTAWRMCKRRRLEWYEDYRGNRHYRVSTYREPALSTFAAMPGT